MKKILSAILLSILSLILIAGFALAATWSFKFPIIISDSSNVTKSYYPILIPNGGTNLSAYTPTGMDTNMQEGSSARKYMMSTDKVATVVPSLGGGGRVTHDLYTGYSPAQTGFPIIVGDAGYITTSDSANLEPSDNFSFS